jgi:hypothetical protein
MTFGDESDDQKCPDGQHPLDLSVVYAGSWLSIPEKKLKDCEPARPEGRLQPFHCDQECIPYDGNNCFKCSSRGREQLQGYGEFQQYLHRLHRTVAAPVRPHVFRARYDWNSFNQDQIQETHYLAVFKCDDIVPLHLEFSVDDVPWLWAEDAFGRRGWMPLHVLPPKPFLVGF